MKTLMFNSKKVIAVLVAAMMCLLSFVYYQPDAEAVFNTDMTYVAFNAKTGARIKSYTISAMPDSAPTPRSVIGNDGRVVDYSKSGVVRLQRRNPNTGGTSYVSAFVVDEHTIMTAGHCVDINEQMSYAISSLDLFDSSGKVELSATPVQVHIPQLFIEGSYSSYDYALITVKEDLSKYMCFNVGVPLDSAINNHISVSVTGCPSSINGKTNTNHDLYTGTGTTSYYSAFRFSHNVDTMDGNSGSPVYTKETIGENIYYTVIGIHTNSGNRAVRINSNIIRFIYANGNLSYT